MAAVKKGRGAGGQGGWKKSERFARPDSFRKRKIFCIRRTVATGYYEESLGVVEPAEQ